MNSNNSNAVRKSGEELTNDCRLSIITLRQADHTFQEIADIANLSKSTVGTAIRKRLNASENPTTPATNAFNMPTLEVIL
ncbi:hypothetical protein G6F43_012179 [Rhizopus delemar]|nr:hypothetical protein G6F43_012179 [Rhizopus delemar]